MNYKNLTLPASSHLYQDVLNLSEVVEDEIEVRNELIITNLKNSFSIETTELNELYLSKIQLALSYRTEHTYILTAYFNKYCISIFLYKNPTLFELQSNNWQIFNLSKTILAYAKTFKTN